jgi:hypothetical protein
VGLFVRKFRALFKSLKHLLSSTISSEAGKGWLLTCICCAELELELEKSRIEHRSTQKIVELLMEEIELNTRPEITNRNKVSNTPDTPGLIYETCLSIMSDQIPQNSDINNLSTLRMRNLI